MTKRIQILSLLVVPVMAMVSPVFSETIYRDSSSPNSTADLNLTDGWIGGVAPGAGDIAYFWNASVGGTMPSAALGDNLHWSGIRVDTNHFNAGSPISESPGYALTVGADG